MQKTQKVNTIKSAPIRYEPQFLSPENLTFHVGIDPGVAPAFVVLATIDGVPVGFASAKLNSANPIVASMPNGFMGAADVMVEAVSEVSLRLHASFARALNYHPVCMDKPRISFVVEDVAASVRPGQRPQDAAKLTFACCAAAAAAERIATGWIASLRDLSDDGASLTRSNMVRPQEWRAFFAMSLSEEVDTKKASVTTALEVFDRLVRLADEQKARTPLARLAAILDVPHEKLCASFVETDRTLRDQLSENHNVADAFLMAAHDFLARQHGWTFYRPRKTSLN